MKNFSEFSIKRSWAGAALNFRALRKTILLSLIPAGAMAIQLIISMAITKNEFVGIGNMLLFHLIIIPILLTTSNFGKTMRLNAKKKDYFITALIIIAILAAVIAIINVVFYYAMDNVINNHLGKLTIYNIYEAFGFASNGAAVGLLQMFGFLFFLGIFVFLLASIQDNYIGWLIDFVLVTFVLVFAFVPILRETVISAILYVLVTGHPAAQILFTVFGGLLLYLIYLPVIKRKRI